MGRGPGPFVTLYSSVLCLGLTQALLNLQYAYRCGRYGTRDIPQALRLWLLKMLLVEMKGAV